MRLALFTDTLADINGVARFLSTLAAHAHQHNIPLRVITSTRKPLAQNPTTVNVPPLFSMQLPRYPQLSPGWPWPTALFAAADAHRPTHVHVSTPGPVGLLGRHYALARSLPLLCTHHTDFPAYLDRLFNHESLHAAASNYLRWFYFPARCVFARSAEYQRKLADLGVERSRTARLRPGIDLDLFHPPASPTHTSTRDITCLYVGRISIEKNLPLLVQAWQTARASFAKQCINARLVVAGEGPYASTMQTALAPHNTHFAGVVRGTALADLYRSADIFLFPSTTDTLGQAVMEAQACALPSLISPEGGPREITTPDTARIVPANPHAWAQAIVHLALDPHQRARMSAAAAVHGATFPFAASAEHFWSVHQQTAEHVPCI